MSIIKRLKLKDKVTLQNLLRSLPFNLSLVLFYLLEVEK